MGEPASVTIEKQAVNVATCSDYNEYMMKTGWVDSSGKGHPGWAGGTEYLAINYSVKYEERIKRARGSVEITTHNLRSNFTTPLKVSRLDWTPGKILSAGCQAAKEKWEKAAEAHEMRHVADITAIVDDANRAWSLKTITGVGGDEQKARTNLKDQVSRLVKDDAAEIKKKIEDSSVERHKTDLVPLMECGSCP